MGLQGSKVRILSPRPVIEKATTGWLFQYTVRASSIRTDRGSTNLSGTNLNVRAKRVRPRRGGGRDARNNPFATTPGQNTNYLAIRSRSEITEDARSNPFAITHGQTPNHSTIKCGSELTEDAQSNPLTPTSETQDLPSDHDRSFNFWAKKVNK